jgi:hypothetical protein
MYIWLAYDLAYYFIGSERGAYVLYSRIGIKMLASYI